MHSSAGRLRACDIQRKAYGLQRRDRCGAMRAKQCEDAKESGVGRPIGAHSKMGPRPGPLTLPPRSASAGRFGDLLSNTLESIASELPAYHHLTSCLSPSSLIKTAGVIVCGCYYCTKEAPNTRNHFHHDSFTPCRTARGKASTDHRRVHNTAYPLPSVSGM